MVLAIDAVFPTQTAPDGIWSAKRAEILTIFMIIMGRDGETLRALTIVRVHQESIISLSLTNGAWHGVDLSVTGGRLDSVASRIRSTHRPGNRNVCSSSFQYHSMSKSRRRRKVITAGQRKKVLVIHVVPSTGLFFPYCCEGVVIYRNTARDILIPATYRGCSGLYKRSSCHGIEERAQMGDGDQRGILKHHDMDMQLRNARVDPV